MVVSAQKKSQMLNYQRGNIVKVFVDIVDQVW